MNIHLNLFSVFSVFSKIANATLVQEFYREVSIEIEQRQIGRCGFVEEAQISEAAGSLSVVLCFESGQVASSIQYVRGRASMCEGESESSEF